MATETRFKVIKQQNPDHYDRLVDEAQKQIDKRFKLYERMAKNEE